MLRDNSAVLANMACPICRKEQNDALEKHLQGTHGMDQTDARVVAKDTEGRENGCSKHSKRMNTSLDSKEMRLAEGQRQYGVMKNAEKPLKYKCPFCAVSYSEMGPLFTHLMKAEGLSEEEAKRKLPSPY